MYTLLVMIAILALLAVWMVFRSWKKSNKTKLYGAGSVLLDTDGGEENREHQSIETDWPTSIETPDGMVDAVTINFNQGGAFIRCQEPLPIGAIFQVKIYVPDKEPIDTKAKVVWNNKNVPLNRVVNRGMGVQFIKENSKAGNRNQPCEP